MKTKPAAMLLTILMLLLVSCNAAEPAPAAVAQPDTPQGGQVLRIAHYLEIMNAGKPYDIGMGRILRSFTEETGVEIELSYIPWDQIDRQLVVSNRAGEPSGDVYNLSSQRLSYLVSNSALQPLDERLNESFPDGALRPNVLEAGTYQGDGRLYLLLQSIHTRGLWYNKDYVTEPPETLEQLLELALEINRPEEDFYALAFWGGNHYGAVESAIAPLTWAAGGSLSDDEGRAIWNNEAVRGAIQFLSDCVNVYAITPQWCLQTSNYNDVQERFGSGGFAMIFDGNYAYSTNALAQGDSERFAFAPYPGIDGPSSSFSNGWCWGIPSKSAQPDLAWSFIEWFEGEEIQLEHAVLEGGLPTRTAVYEQMREQVSLFDDFADNFLRHGRPMDAFVYYQEATEELAMAAATYCLDPENDLDELLQTAMTNYNNKYY